MMKILRKTSISFMLPCINQPSILICFQGGRWDVFQVGLSVRLHSLPSLKTIITTFSIVFRIHFDYFNINFQSSSSNIKYQSITIRKNSRITCKPVTPSYKSDPHNHLTQCNKFPPSSRNKS